jgi:uncharacterized membrane protein
MMPSSLVLVVIAIGAGLFYWLHSREKKREASGQSRLATWRLMLATLFGLIALFAGGCSLAFLPTALGGDAYVPVTLVLVIGVLPCGLAILFWWLSLRRGKS